MSLCSSFKYNRQCGLNTLNKHFQSDGWTKLRAMQLYSEENKNDAKLPSMATPELKKLMYGLKNCGDKNLVSGIFYLLFVRFVLVLSSAASF